MPDDGKALALAAHYLSIGQPQRALDALDAGPDIDSTIFWLLRGHALYDLERYRDAAGAAQTGLSHDPDSVPLLYLLCNAQTEQGDFSGAERSILAALQQDAENPGLLARYAVLVARANQLDKATRLLDEAVRIGPEEASVQRARLILSYLRGDDKQASARGRELLREDPENVFGHYMLGCALSGMGNVGAADRYLVTAARLNPAAKVFADAARQSRYVNHPLLWPLKPITRLGTARVWIGAMVIIYGLRMIGLSEVALIFAAAYLLLAVYSWVVPPLLRRWLRRRAL